MPVSVVVGGQFGSEGKGKVAKYLAEKLGATAVVRCGGPNSGHTVINDENETVVFQQLPTASILPNVKSVISAGSYVDVRILFSEIKLTGGTPDTLLIDPYAVIITDLIHHAEQSGQLRELIGSTASGTGEAVLSRIRREDKITFAKDVPSLSPYLKDTRLFLRAALKKNARIILEGTQGYGLSLIHSPYYPYVTSRDTTAAGFLAEIGLSPLDVDDVVLTLRAFPIRVPGNSGPLPEEIDWETVTKEAGSPNKLFEITSVTKAKRRVARFNEEIVLLAIQANNPTNIVLNHLDYVDWKINDQGITPKIQKFISLIENRINRSIDFIGFNPIDIIKS